MLHAQATRSVNAMQRALRPAQPCHGLRAASRHARTPTLPHTSQPRCLSASTQYGAPPLCRRTAVCWSYQHEPSRRRLVPPATVSIASGLPAQPQDTASGQSGSAVAALFAMWQQLLRLVATVAAAMIFVLAGCAQPQSALAAAARCAQHASLRCFGTASCHLCLEPGWGKVVLARAH